MSAFQLRRPAVTSDRMGRVAQSAQTIARARPELIALLLLAAALNLWGLDRNGFANEYYAAAVRSMSSSWHAFIYGSFDAAGVMTVDKPPLASWVQVGFVKVFGYSSWSLLVPQALMGVASVALVYDLVRRPFGRVAGTVAGLVLALTPIAVAVSRHNNPDALLVLCAVAAVWFCVRALEDGRTRWLVLSGVAVGLGFETKMAVALMVVPGIVAAYLWIAPRGMKAAIGQVAAFTGAAVAVGAAWPLLLALTPAAGRPWVSGTADNSIWSLIFGYNGLGRIVGQSGGPGGMGGGPGGGGGGSMFGGPAGATRLVESSLGGQAGWLIGAALVGGVAVVLATRLRRTDVRSGWIILVGGAFLTCAVAFSTAKGIFHPYYVSLLAPFTAALAGALVPHVTGGDAKARVLACAGVAAAVVTELMVLHNLPGELTWLRPVLFVAGAGLVAMLAVGLPDRARRVVLVAAVGLVLLAPAAWSVQTLGHATNGTFPAGGPQTVGMGGGPGGGGPPGGPRGGRGMATGGPPGAAGGGGGGGMFGGNSQSLNQAVAYARAHGGGTVVTGSQQGASGPIIESGADVAAIGGFSGRESQVSTSWLADAVREGRVRWVLADQSGMGGRQDARVGDRQVMSTVAETCTSVPSVSGLYDCSGSAAALEEGSS